MEITFILLQKLYSCIQPRIARMWNQMTQGPYSNFFGLIGTGFCVIVFFLLFPADLAFFSLMAAVYWGADPNILITQIETAKINSHNISNGSFGQTIDHIFDWVVQQISISTSAHMLAGNTLAVLLMFGIAFIFIKELFWSHNFLPLNIQRPWQRNVLFSICITIIFLITFYYSFVLFYGEHSKYIAETQQVYASDNIFDNSQIINTNNNINLKGTNGIQLTREIALVGYGIAMILSTSLAIWGILLFIRISFTLIFCIMLIIARGIVYLIEIPYTITGVKIGSIKLQNIYPDNPSATTENEQYQNKLCENNEIAESLSQENDDPDLAEILNEEERQRIITRNPMGI